jgi:hypothetical protein
MNAMTTKPSRVPEHLNVAFTTGHAEVMPPRDRRFFAVDIVKLTNAQQHAQHLEAHAAHIVAQQRASGIRVRLCSTGTYSLYNAAGQFIGRTPPVGTPPHIAPALAKNAAARMAYSEELANVCRLADLDYENTGTVMPSTIATIRALLLTIGAV